MNESICERFYEETARIEKLEQSVEFYKSRCDELQRVQKRMRDPERKLVCDILANGHTLLR